MFFFSRRKKKKDHDNIEDVVEKGTDEENLKGEISGNSEKDETYEKKDDGIRKQMEQEMLTQDKPVTTGKTDAIRFVRNNCEAIAENERQIAEAKKEYEKVIYRKEILALTRSELGKRMKEAAQKKLLYKERQFVTGIPFSDMDKEAKTDDFVVV